MCKQVSAIITTHNRLDLLKRAIESVKKQTYPYIELIVVDDASTDGTQEYCSRQDFIYIRIQKGESRGGNYARNLGIKSAHGDYVAFLDDDDYWLNEKIEKQVRVLDESDCEVVHCYRNLEYVDKDGNSNIEYCPLSFFCQGNLKRRILWQITIFTSAAMIKRKALIDVGMFDENIGFWQEYELSIRLAQRKPFLLIPEALLVYRINLYDPYRLTNKYYEWIRSVDYIYAKHKILYQKLSIWQRLRVNVLYWRDSSNRAKRVGLKSIARRHNFLYTTIGFPYRVFDKLLLFFYRYKS